MMRIHTNIELHLYIAMKLIHTSCSDDDELMGAAGVVIGPLSSLIFEQRFVSLLLVLVVSMLMARCGVACNVFDVSLSHETVCRKGLNGLPLK